MSGNLTTEDVQLIAGLINDKFTDLAKHVSKEIRMVKTTVQANHSISIEARDLGKMTNGRVSKLEDDIYGEIDKHGNIQTGKEGILHGFLYVEKWKWIYKYWQVPALITLFFTALYIKESRDFIIRIMDKII